MKSIIKLIEYDQEKRISIYDLILNKKIVKINNKEYLKLKFSYIEINDDNFKWII
jgi:hypothetical protein